jgi:hypothetical protein
MYTEFQKQEAKAKRNLAIFHGVVFGLASLLALSLSFIVGLSSTI